MAITLAIYKLESCTWYHFVRIEVFHMTSYLEFEILEISFMKILKTPKKSQEWLKLWLHTSKRAALGIIGVYQMI
jgi:hypothetical protein